MTLNVNLEDVPFEILETVKARILARRRKLDEAQEQKPREALDPKPQYRKHAPDAWSWKRPQQSAASAFEIEDEPPVDVAFLLTPSGPFNPNITGPFGGRPTDPTVEINGAAIGEVFGYENTYWSAVQEGEDVTEPPRPPGGASGVCRPGYSYFVVTWWDYPYDIPWGGSTQPTKFELFWRVCE